MDEAKPGPPRERKRASQPSRWHLEPSWRPCDRPGTDARPTGLTRSAVRHCASSVGASFIPSANTHVLSSTSPASSTIPGPWAREQAHARATSLTRTYQSRSPKQSDQASRDRCWSSEWERQQDSSWLQAMRDLGPARVPTGPGQSPQETL